MSDFPNEFKKVLKVVLPHQSKLMFYVIMAKLPNIQACIAVGAIARQCAPTLGIRWDRPFNSRSQNEVAPSG